MRRSLPLLTDENFHGDIVRGLLLSEPGLDLVRAQDVGLSGVDDPGVLAWAAANVRVLLTHDRRTMPQFAYDRVRRGLAMSGVIVVKRSIAHREIIEEILLLAGASLEGEYEGQVRYLPLR